MPQLTSQRTFMASPVSSSSSFLPEDALAIGVVTVTHVTAIPLPRARPSEPPWVATSRDGNSVRPPRIPPRHARPIWARRRSPLPCDRPALGPSLPGETLLERSGHAGRSMLTSCITHLRGWASLCQSLFRGGRGTWEPTVRPQDPAALVCTAPGDCRAITCRSSRQQRTVCSLIMGSTSRSSTPTRVRLASWPPRPARSTSA